MIYADKLRGKNFQKYLNASRKNNDLFLVRGRTCSEKPLDKFPAEAPNVPRVSFGEDEVKDIIFCAIPHCRKK